MAKEHQSHFLQLRAQGINLSQLEAYEVGSGGEVRLYFPSGRKVVLGGPDPEAFLAAVGHDMSIKLRSVPAPKGARATLQQMAEASKSGRKPKRRDDDPDGVFAR